MFLVEKGSQLLLIMQEYLRPQPSLTVTRDMQISISMSIKKISDATCKKYTTSEQMSCIVDKIQQKIMGIEVSCLPFQYRNVFPKLYLAYPQCKNDFELAMFNKSFYV